MKCTAYCLVGSFQFPELVEKLEREESALKAFREVAYFDCGSGHAFIFAYGVAVFWAVNEQQIHSVMQKLRLFAISPIDLPAQDDFTFSFGSIFKVVGEEIILDSADPLVMLALSHAFAQSVKLEIFEARVKQVVTSAQQLVDQLSTTGQIHLNRREIAKRIGWLMQQRYSINLHCDVLDTPDFFWDSSKLERYYQAGTAYLDLSQRVSVLHRRLDTASEAFEILTTEVNHRHSSFLEWIIIVLISIEIAMGLATHWSLFFPFLTHL